MLKLTDLGWAEDTDERDMQCELLEKELAKLVGIASLPLMQEMAPAVAPEPRTLEDHLCPATFVLQALTKDGKLATHKLDGYDIPSRHPPIPEAKLQMIVLDDSIPVWNHLRLCWGRGSRILFGKLR